MMSKRKKTGVLATLSGLKGGDMVFYKNVLNRNLCVKTLHPFCYFAAAGGAISHFRRVHVVYRIEHW